MLGKPISIDPLPDYLGDQPELTEQRSGLERRLRELKQAWDDHEARTQGSGSTIRELVEGKAEDREAVISLAETEAQLRRDVIGCKQAVHAATIEAHGKAKVQVAELAEWVEDAVVSLGWRKPDARDWHFLDRFPALEKAREHAAIARHARVWGGGDASYDSRALDEMLDRVKAGHLDRWRDPNRMVRESMYGDVTTTTAAHVAACGGTILEEMGG